MSKNKARIIRTRCADENHEVHTLEGGNGAYRRKPCKDCPFKRDAVGVFPPEAFKLSAHTSYDGAKAVFSCHSQKMERPATCAGFILTAHHNISLRFGWIIDGKFRDVHDGGFDLFDSYREMAIANGVHPDDPAILECR